LDADLIHAEGDVLGNAYEYLIGQFASETGKKAGEFYTPHGPAQILCRIAMNGQEDKVVGCGRFQAGRAFHGLFLHHRALSC